MFVGLTQEAPGLRTEGFGQSHGFSDLEEVASGEGWFITFWFMSYMIDRTPLPPSPIFFLKHKSKFTFSPMFFPESDIICRR